MNTKKIRFGAFVAGAFGITISLTDMLSIVEALKLVPVFTRTEVIPKQVVKVVSVEDEGTKAFTTKITEPALEMIFYVEKMRGRPMPFKISALGTDRDEYVSKGVDQPFELSVGAADLGYKLDYGSISIDLPLDAEIDTGEEFLVCMSYDPIPYFPWVHTYVYLLIIATPPGPDRLGLSDARSASAQDHFLDDVDLKNLDTPFFTWIDPDTQEPSAASLRKLVTKVRASLFGADHYILSEGLALTETDCSESKLREMFEEKEV
ncbi:hypothetical protein [Alloyangia pacifica]|uniref:hypothetical protein n=1 Tax=Alloyangia pacifica TaxID=311180 RepID=UPI0031CE5EDC